MKTKESQKRKSLELEPFYQAMEDEPKLLEEAFEILLEMVNSEPKSAKKLALLIKEDFHDLYKEIAKLCKSNETKGNTSSCCSGL